MQRFIVSKAVPRIFAIIVALLLLIPGSAHAGVSVSVGGSTNWKVTSTASTNYDTRKIGQTLTGTAKVDFKARVLGVPMPVTGHYANSFPTTFSRPSLKSASNANLTSRNYSKLNNAYLGASQWEVRGKSSFWGEKTVKIVGDAKANSRGTKYFYAGTISCGSRCTNANSIVRIIVK